MHGVDPGGMKNRGLAARLGCAPAGIRLVFRREKSFRTQTASAFAAAVLVAGFAALVAGALMVLAVLGGH